MVAFAANSVLCRLALSEPVIDAASFSSLRLLSGALILVLISWSTRRGKLSLNKSNWFSAALLAVYAISFSFGYLKLATAMGALILFGAVQVTMMIAGFLSGERMSLVGWVGFSFSMGGLLVLVNPGVSAPSLSGAALMFLSGAAWGLYSLMGRESKDSVLSTTSNFILAAPMALIVSLIFSQDLHLTTKGTVLAVTSGSVTSGCGYIIWYAALRRLTSTRAAIVQFSVPVLAAIGGVVFLSESITFRLLMSSVLILGGVALAINARHNKIGR